MSVDGWIVYHDESHNKHILAVAINIFTKYWENPANELGLQLIVDLANPSYFTTLESISNLVKQLDILIDYWTQKTDEDRWLITDRMENTRRFLQTVETEWGDIDYVTFG